MQQEVFGCQPEGAKASVSLSSVTGAKLLHRKTASQTGTASQSVCMLMWHLLSSRREDAWHTLPYDEAFSCQTGEVGGLEVRLEVKLVRQEVRLEVPSCRYSGRRASYGAPGRLLHRALSSCTVPPEAGSCGALSHVTLMYLNSIVQNFQAKFHPTILKSAASDRKLQGTSSRQPIYIK